MLSQISSEKLAQYIDHTLLRPDATSDEITKTCAEAVEHGFYSVCVEPKWISLVVSRLAGSRVLPITVIDFPMGAGSVEKKRKETRDAVAAGAKEIDMVLNRALLKSRDFVALYQEIQAVVGAAAGVPVKVILETSELDNLEKIAASAIAVSAGASFVKTSTGFSKSGASEEDVKLMRQTVGEHVGVKASGGVRSYADALRMIRAGASRLGTSASIAIVRGASLEGSSY